MERRVVVDLKSIWSPRGERQASLDCIPQYVRTALVKAGEGDNTVVLTGTGPIWLYLIIAAALREKVGKLIYNSPVTGDVVILDNRAHDVI